MKLIEFEFQLRLNDYAMSNLQCHDFYEIYFLIEGDRKIIFENKSLPVSNNSLVIIPPFTMHRTEGGSYKRINIYTSNDIVDLLSLNPIVSIDTITAFNLNTEISKIIYPLLKLGLDVKSVNIESDKRNKAAIFTTIMYYLSKTKLVTLETTHDELHTDYEILKVTNFIDKHYSEKITLPLLCSKFIFTKSNLCRRFKLATSHSITDYLLFIRLSNAKHLLFTTNLSMENIAITCGFDNANYFCLMFKKKVGTSPSAYRKMK